MFAFWARDSSTLRWSRTLVTLCQGEQKVMLVSSDDIILQGSDWPEVSFNATDCGVEDVESWTSSVTYGSGRYER